MPDERDSRGRFVNVEKVVSEMASEWTATQRTLGEQGQAIQNLASAQKDMARSIDTLAETFRTDNRSLASTLDRKTSTDLGKVIGLTLSAMGVLVTFILLYSQGDKNRMDSLDGSIEKLFDAVQQHHRLEGHPAGMAKINAESRRLDEQIIDARRDIVALDTTLQREMRLLDERLQNEFNARIGRAQDDADKALLDLASRAGKRFNRDDYERNIVPVLEKFQEWIHTHDQTVSALNSRQDENIKTLVQEVAALRSDMKEVRESRFDSEKGFNLLARFSVIEKLVEDIQSEQQRRTRQVYNAEQKAVK